MSFRHLYKSLVGDVPKLSEPKAKQLINDALRQIYDYHLWHFLLEQSYISIPAQISSGTMNLTRGLTTVTPDATAKNLLDTFGLLPPLTECQLRVGNGQPYQISAYDPSGSGTLTLDQPYLGVTNPLATYSIYRAYFIPPISLEAGTIDFLRFVYIHNREMGYKPLTLTSQRYLNRVDPERLSYSEAYSYAPLKSKSLDINGTTIRVPVFEFWPHPTSARSLFCIYQKHGLLLEDDADDIPTPLTDELVRSLARYKAYEWADSHKGEFRELLAVNWTRKRSEIMDPRSFDSYPYQLARCVKLDREMFMSSMISNYYVEIYGQQLPGGNYYQNHAIGGGYQTV